MFLCISVPAKGGFIRFFAYGIPPTGSTFREKLRAPQLHWLFKLPTAACFCRGLGRTRDPPRIGLCRGSGKVRVVLFFLQPLVHTPLHFPEILILRSVDRSGYVMQHRNGPGDYERVKGRLRNETTTCKGGGGVVSPPIALGPCMSVSPR